ncbi:dTDP-4-dehydrorhamnose 3,5-epimerase [Ornithinibacillus californiensis]|uniref:dTDP-4-dehydrorhamnose 3,5-epimerase n=1 Tax=Ornithinibacillus californiensis TaxID=161536 RepID=UPI00064DF581|nr:dTDP-4-dehydrorhamnose 3,5-epimerase [Ornithinibacillus californiensis]
MKIIHTKLQGVYILEPLVYEDHRGFFMESYNKQSLEKSGLEYNFVQDNHSLSTEASVIRGLHYQLNPKAQSKLVRVGSGVIWDVVVDIRPESNTFAQWFGIILSEKNKRQVIVPKGFAHGFCTLVPDTSVLYKVDEYYDPDLERGILWNDPQLNIDWPVSNPILSEKDSNLPLLKHAENNF